MDEAEADVLAYMTFPVQHRTKLHSTNPIERLNGEIKRRTADRVLCRARMKRLLAFPRSSPAHVLRASETSGLRSPTSSLAPAPDHDTVFGLVLTIASYRAVAGLTITRPPTPYAKFSSSSPRMLARSDRYAPREGRNRSEIKGGSYSILAFRSRAGAPMIAKLVRVEVQCGHMQRSLAD